MEDGGCEEWRLDARAAYRDNFKSTEPRQNPVIKDANGKTHTCEDVGELCYLCERTDVMFTFAEVNLAYEVLTGKEIDKLAFEHSRKNAIDDARKGCYHNGRFDAERFKLRKAEILEEFTMDDAHAYEEKSCEGKLYLQDETVYIGLDTWYRLVK